MDDALHFMSKSDADDFRARAARAFEGALTPVQIHPDRLVGEDGEYYLLRDVAEKCHKADRGRKDWDMIIARHVMEVFPPVPEAVSAAPTPEIAKLTDTELLKIIHTQLCSTEDFPVEVDASPWASLECFGHMAELLVADLPEMEIPLSEADVYARDENALWTRARENTAAAQSDRTDKYLTSSGATITIATGNSPFFASRVVFIEPLLREVFGDRDYPFGIVFGVPDRHTVVLHPLDDSRSVDAIREVAERTAYEWTQASRQLSPWIYWWNGDYLQEVSRMDRRGSAEVIAKGPFLEALNALPEP
jgi:hypothetical protein